MSLQSDVEFNNATNTSNMNTIDTMTSQSTSNHNFVNVFKIFYEAGLSEMELHNWNICPQLDLYRQQCQHEIISIDHSLPLNYQDINVLEYEKKEFIHNEFVSANNIDTNTVINQEDEDDDNNEINFHFSDSIMSPSDSPTTLPTAGSASQINWGSVSKPSRLSSSSPMRRSSLINENSSSMLNVMNDLEAEPSLSDNPCTDFQRDETDIDTHMNSPSVTVMTRLSEEDHTQIGTKVVTTEKDFNLFDMDALRQSNSWAGARHWKYKLRERQPSAVTQTTDMNKEDSEHTIALSKKKKSKTVSKEKIIIDFSESGWVSETEFIIPKKLKNKSDSTMLTEAAIKKMDDNASRLLLPLDAKIDVQDLCRLFLRPVVKVAPKGLRHLITVPRVGGRGRYVSMNNSVKEEEDLVWGEVRVPESHFAANAGNNDDYDDADGDEFGYDNNYDDDEQEVEANLDSLAVKMVGLSINTSSLLQAPRVVDKVQIRYHTLLMLSDLNLIVK